jgi:uncharacterized protein YhaN
MRILSCYIAGFGKFIDKTFDFSVNPVVIKEDNGWGKTTLADFIRCMFYGHDAGRNKAIENNERAKYAPWRSGAYGGSLTFSYQNKRYRVERSFGKTPAYDTTRIYDSNNMPTFEFGDKGEKLGEILFGMDADGYRRSVYIPQGEIRTDGMPDTMKNCLLSLLNTGGAGGDSAIDKLDAADRALRSKRRPAQGKLDKIDERLNEISHQKAECDYALMQAEALQKAIAEAEGNIERCTRRLQDLSEAIDRESRRSELAVKKQAYDEAQAALLGAEKEIASLNVFFAGLNPATVNVDGIQAAVTEYYEEKTSVDEAEKRRAEIEEAYRWLLTLKTKKEALEKTLDSYDEILDKKSGKKGAGTRRRRNVTTIIPPKRKENKWILLVGILVAVLGAVAIEKMLSLGLVLLSLGVGAMAFVFFRVVPRKKKGPKPEKTEDNEEIDHELQEKYDETLEKLQDVEEEIKGFAPDLETEYDTLTEKKEQGKKTLFARSQAIEKFLSNFKFGEIYDYRVAVMTLQDNAARYAHLLETQQSQQKKLQEFSQEPALTMERGSLDVDMRTLQSQKLRETEKKEDWTQRRASALAQLETLAGQTDKNALISEEENLLEEKKRLEKRHRAILSAKEILLRAKENLAGKYLEPVETGCRYYMQLLSVGEKQPMLRFAADGAVLCEESGILREMGYYSEGMKELVGLCTRFAFADAVFQKETPTLILDDPFVNLDDQKTEKAKRLVRELAKKYQIVYLTCKSERKL